MNDLNTLFPLGTTRIVLLCIIATLFFGAQFLRTKRWHHLIRAAATALFLLVFINPNNKVYFYGVGILVGALMLASLIVGGIYGRQDALAEKAAKAAAAAAAAQNDSSTEA